jgi:hypothetical protein
MGISLNGLTPAGTYPGLIKTGDNTAIDGTPKVLSDGNGNNLPMEVSTTGVNLTGSPTVNSVAIANTTQVAAKQDTLVSGTNIKTINGTSVLGSGNIVTPSTPPSGVSGAIQFSNGSAFASDAANLFWDDTNNRLGIGTNAPSATAHFKGSGSTSATTSLLVQNSAGVSSLQVNDNCSVFNYGKGAKTGNAVFGLAALNSITSGDYNSAFGNQALGANTSASQNNAFGYQALFLTTTGADNNAMGTACMLFNTSGSQNVAMGTTVMFNNSSGSQNTAIGYNALNANTTGSSNTALGHGTVSGNFSGSVILGRSATATASNQFVIGSSAYNAGAVTTESNSSTKVWNVIINGVAEKILLA